MKIQAIIIDGWHTGEVIEMGHILPVIKLLKPHTLTVCDCNDDDEHFPKPPENIEYKICFTSVDRKVVLYSTTGKSDDVFKWFIQSIRFKPYNRHERLIFNCHDPKAWV